jgi:chromosome segregation ATPase
MSEKKAYREKLQSQLDEWDAKIDVLKAKANKAEASAKVEYQKTIEDLQDKRSKAKDKLQELKNASGDAWEDLKEGVEESWSRLGAAIKEATSRFK